MSLYPTVSVSLPKHPKRLYALPLIGYIVKGISLIPLSIILFVYGIVAFFAYIINSFVILFSGTYWDFAYRIAIGALQYHTRMHFFLYGVTDAYPGFSMHKKHSITIEIPKPEKSNKFLNFPVLGLITRLILLIPFFIYVHIIALSTTAALIGAILFVFFRGFYPESCFEIIRDSQRLTLASFSYMLGLSDTYPTFAISMNHKKIKIFFIAIGILLFLLGKGGRKMEKIGVHQNFRNTYPQSYR